MNLYHFKRQSFQGQTLYPLNQLQSIFPDAYAEEIKKYQGRELLMQATVPHFNCLWNDVLHFCPIPMNEVIQAVFDAHTELGLDMVEYKKRFMGREYFAFSAQDLKEDNLLVFLNNRKMPAGTNFTGVEDLFHSYSTGRKFIQQTIPSLHRGYLKNCLEKGERPLLFMHLPHVLYKGTVDVSLAKVEKLKL